MAAVLELHNIHKTYRMGETDVHALRGVSLAVQEGELVAIMGASGSGKSTLMNILGCLDRPTGGAYALAGRQVAALGRAERAAIRNGFIGFVFQSFHLLARTSALENVELPLVYGGVGRKERRQRAVAALEQVGLGERMGHHPSQLSGGQQQRVAIARALVTRPRVLLADEPTGNLDSRTSADVMALLQGIHDQGLTVVLVTHSPEVAEHAGRVVVMRDGRMASDRAQQPRRAVAPPPEQP